MGSEKKTAPSLEAQPRQITTHSGARFIIRPIEPGDADAYAGLIDGLPSADRRFRFFNALQSLPPKLCDDLTNIDHRDHEAFVAITSRDGELKGISGVVRIIRTADSQIGDFAIVVGANFRNLGLGYSLMQYAINFARESGLRTLRGTVMSKNRAMLKICHELGFKTQFDIHDATLTIVILNL